MLFTFLRTLLLLSKTLFPRPRLVPLTSSATLASLRYAYSFKASYDWFRCHPGNDDKGIWGVRAASAREVSDYTNL